MFVLILYRLIPFKEPGVNGYNLEFPGSDRSVVKRTQHYNYEHFKENPVQIQTYFTVPSCLVMFFTILLAGFFALFTKFSFTRNLLETYPHIFTFGMFTKEGPSRQQINETSFSIRIKGKGWSKNTDDEPNEELDKEMEVLVSGPDPGYTATSSFIIQSALTILKDRDSMPVGGVLTPASAFRNTKLVDRLSKRNITFKIVSA